MLLANNINFKRNNKTIIKDINISLPPKKIIHLLGKNGVGKTTLLKILTNILEPEIGEIFWNGKNIKKNPFDFYKNTTFIMDKQSSNNALSVKENIFFWCKLFYSKINSQEIDSVLELLELLEILTDFKEKSIVNPMRKADKLVAYLDIRKAKDLLGWEPKVGKEEGIKRLIDWQKSNLL